MIVNPDETIFTNFGHISIIIYLYQQTKNGTLSNYCTLIKMLRNNKNDFSIGINPFLMGGNWKIKKNPLKKN